MTYEQALNFDQKWTAEQACNDLERYLLRDEKPAYKAVALGMQALKKHIPTAIIVETEVDREFEDYICPRCKNTLQQRRKGAKNITIFKYRHCYNCGQAIDWRDTDESVSSI